MISTLRGGAYEYRHGFNWTALAALGSGSGNRTGGTGGAVP